MKYPMDGWMDGWILLLEDQSRAEKKGFALSKTVIIPGFGVQ